MPPEPDVDRRRQLALLVALTREALDALADGDTDALRALEARRHRVVVSLRGGPVEPECAALADEARALDERLLDEAMRARDALGAKVRGLHAVARAQAGYAATDSLGPGARGA